jgi:guanylate kinase
MTTRPPRGEEKNGKDYFFVNEQQFFDTRNADGFLEHATFSGHFLWHTHFLCSRTNRQRQNRGVGN